MVVIAPAADGVPPREIIVLLFLALKRRAAEEKKARVVVGTVIFLSKDDLFGGDVASAGDGADERRSPTAFDCIFFRASAKKPPAFLSRNCVSKFDLFFKPQNREHMSRMCIASHHSFVYIFSRRYTHAHTHTHTHTHTH